MTKIVGRGRSIEDATRAEKRAASVGLHTFRHTSATVMDSLGFPSRIKKRRLGHSDGDVTGNYTRSSSADERAAAEKLGEIFGQDWPNPNEKVDEKVAENTAHPFPNLSKMQQRLPDALPGSPL